MIITGFFGGYFGGCFGGCFGRCFGGCSGRCAAAGPALGTGPFRFLTPWIVRSSCGRRQFPLRLLWRIWLARIAFIFWIRPLRHFGWTFLGRWFVRASWTLTGRWWWRTRVVRSPMTRLVHHHRRWRRSPSDQATVATWELLLLLLLLRHHRMETRIHRRMHAHSGRMRHHSARVDHLRMPHIHHGAAVGHGHTGHTLVAGRAFHGAFNHPNPPQKWTAVVPASCLRSSGCGPHPRSPI